VQRKLLGADSSRQGQYGIKLSGWYFRRDHPEATTWWPCITVLLLELLLCEAYRRRVSADAMQLDWFCTDMLNGIPDRINYVTIRISE
jgi:hypothetical protein